MVTRLQAFQRVFVPLQQQKCRWIQAHTPNIVGIIENVAENAEQTPVMPPDPGVKHAAK